MLKDRIVLLLVMITVVLLIFLMTGIAYAIETDTILKINDSELLISESPEFKVVFTGEPTYSGNGEAEVFLINDTEATMNITGLKNVGDIVTVMFTVSNKNNDIDVELNTRITNTNTEYFKVTSNLSEEILKSRTGATNLSVMVELLKLPVKNSENTNISIDIIANQR